MVKRFRVSLAASLAGTVLGGQAWADTPVKQGLPVGLIQDAAAYQGYVQRLTATSPNFTDGASVAATLKSSAAIDPKVLVRGAVAYGAVAALGSSTLVADLQAAGNSSENRHTMAGYIRANPAYVFIFKGSDEAAGLARTAIGPTGLRVMTIGAAVKQSAYSIQKQAWSKQDVVDRPGRLAAIEAATSIPVAPSDALITQLQAQASGSGRLVAMAEPVKPPYGPLVAQALQLAALGALGEATEADTASLRDLVTESNSSSCLTMARHNLYQCLAVAKPNYEDVFCLGQHILTDTGVCLSHNAGVEPAVEPVTPKVKVKAKTKKRRGRGR